MTPPFENGKNVPWFSIALTIHFLVPTTWNLICRTFAVPKSDSTLLVCLRWSRRGTAVVVYLIKLLFMWSLTGPTMRCLSSKSLVVEEPIATLSPECGQRVARQLRPDTFWRCLQCHRPSVICFMLWFANDAPAMSAVAGRSRASRRFPYCHIDLPTSSMGWAFVKSFGRSLFANLVFPSSRFSWHVLSMIPVLDWTLMRGFVVDVPVAFSSFAWPYGSPGKRPEFLEIDWIFVVWFDSRASLP